MSYRVEEPVLVGESSNAFTFSLELLESFNLFVVGQNSLQDLNFLGGKVSEVKGVDGSHERLLAQFDLAPSDGCNHETKHIHTHESVTSRHGCIVSTKHRSKHCALEHNVSVIGDILGYRVHLTSFSSATEQCLRNHENSIYYMYSCYIVGSIFRLTNVAHALWLKQSERFRLLLGMRQGGSIVHVKSDVRQLEHLLELVEVDLLQNKNQNNKYGS